MKPVRYLFRNINPFVFSFWLNWVPISLLSTGDLDVARKSPQGMGYKVPKDVLVYSLNEEGISILLRDLLLPAF